MFLVLVIYSIICAVIGNSLGKKRRIGGSTGAILGLLLGVIGLIIVALSAEINDNDIIEQHYIPKANINVADQLTKWHELKEKGAITSEEFEQKKNELLSK